MSDDLTTVLLQEKVAELEQQLAEREAAIKLLRDAIDDVRWRDVSDDGIPTEAQEVLFVRGGETLHGAFIGGVFWRSNKQCAALYWMPLPKPPKAIAATEPKP